MTYQLLQGDNRQVLRTLPEKSVHTIVTSPPYFGLRDYGVDGQIGLEETPAAYVAELVAVFRECWRVLRDDGTLWLNLGDSYATNPGNGRGGESSIDGAPPHRSGVSKVSGVGANINNLLTQAVKEGVIFLGAGCSLTVTAKRDGILKHDKLTPKLELAPLFGVKRVFIKDGNNHLCQVFDSLTSIGSLWVSASVSWAAIGQANTDIVFDMVDDLGIIVTDHDLDTNAPFKVAVGSGPAKHSEATFTIKEAAEPVAESIGDSETVRDAIALDSLGECVAQVDTVDKSVSLADTLVFSTGHRSDFRVAKASEKQFLLSLMGGRCEIAFISIAHVFVSNSFGSVIHYTELYDKAKRKANTELPKQELGIPEMVKRALMEEGWICRSTIIWHKPNPMPESVTDRPTKAHEYIFLLTKSQRYYYDAEAVREPAQDWGSRERKIGQAFTVGVMPNGAPHKGLRDGDFSDRGRNRRSVWTVATQPYAGAHFATFPPALIEPCILAGCPVGGVVLDPFNGSGTTGAVACAHGRDYIGIDLNADYIALAHDRIREAINESGRAYVQPICKATDYVGLPMFGGGL